MAPRSQTLADRFGRAIFFALFFVSGFTALLYQIIWQRILTFFSGADLDSVTMVVAAFMAGLGFGSLAGGHLADRIGPRHRVIALAACEFAVAAFALGSTYVYYDLLYVRLGVLDLPRGVVAALLFLVTLWPTTWMGMSLPLAARIVATDTREPARRLPALYAWNTLGAALGALTTVAFLFPIAGFQAILSWGAVLNIACGAGVLIAAPRLLTQDESASDSVVSPSERPLGWPAWIVASALSGFVALSLEIIWFRILGVTVKAGSFAFGGLMAIYLGGIGLGALAVSHPRLRRLSPGSLFLTLQIAIPLYAALAFALFIAVAGHASWAEVLRAHFGAYDNGPGFRILYLVIYGVIPLWLVGPSTVMMGASFGLLHRAVQDDLGLMGRRLGLLQASNIVGSTLGAIVTGLWLVDALGAAGALRVLTGASLVSLGLYVRLRGRIQPLAVLGAAGATALAVVATPSPPLVWATLHGSTERTTISAEDRTGVAVLKDDEGETIVFANGLGQSRLPYGDVHTALGALPALLHPAPRAIAVIGLGSGDTLFAAGGRTETESLVCIEIVAPQYDTLRRLDERGAYLGLSRLLKDPRIQYVFTDGRAFLRHGTERYDVIEADALRPASAYSGNLYSVEYFELLRSRLAPGGLAVTWVPTPRVLGTFVSVFPHVLVLGEIAVGSEAPIPFDEGAVRARVREPAIQQYYLSGGVRIGEVVEPFLAATQLFRPEEDRSLLTNLNRDLFPRDEFGAK